MLGYHVAYSKPIRNIYKSILDMDLYEVLTLALSCLFWKRYHDYIKIYCDEDYYNKLKNMDLLWLWDEVDNKTMSSIPQNLNHDRFWSYSKMYINSLQSEQFYNIDLDLFTRAPMPEFTTDFTVAHYEIVDSKKSLMVLLSTIGYHYRNLPNVLHMLSIQNKECFSVGV